MKTIVLGDTHGRDYWKEIVEKENPDRVIFIGDYFDSFDIKSDVQINNFLDICEYKRSSGKDVIMLIGNHDHHYFAAVGNTGTSGYQPIACHSISHALEANKDLLQMAYLQDDILFTHAGVGETFMDNIYGKDGWKIETLVEDLNELMLHKPLAFVFDGREPSGDNMGQTPIWIRPLSLTKDSHNLRKTFKQVVGHTGQRQIYTDDKSTLGGKYYFIDCLGGSKEYLIIEDGIKVGKL